MPSFLFNYNIIDRCKNGKIQFYFRLPVKRCSFGDVFAHGQLYVALSRVRNWKNICILTTEGKASNNGLYTGNTANPVFRELLI